jgi:hypothetical protein
MRTKRNAYRVLVAKSEGMSLLGISTLRLEDNIKMDLRDRMGGIYWIHLAQVRDK